MKVIKKLVDNYGLPEAFYMDQAGIYGKLDRDWESQISRAFDQVGIRLILASSPQAKGRVERLFRTLQDRLIAEMSFYDIKTLDEANEFLKGFIKRFNNQFGVPAQEDPSFRKNVFGDLNLIFCKKETRKIYTGNIFSYEAVTWLIDKKACYRGRYMNINTHVDGSQSFDIMGKKMYPRPVKTMRVYRNKRRVG
jgi:hypothetical protein